MTIFSHSVIAGSSSMARTRLRRFGTEVGVAIVYLPESVNLPRGVSEPYIRAASRQKGDTMSCFDALWGGGRR